MRPYISLHIHRQTWLAVACTGLTRANEPSAGIVRGGTRADLSRSGDSRSRWEASCAREPDCRRTRTSSRRCWRGQAEAHHGSAPEESEAQVAQGGPTGAWMDKQNDRRRQLWSFSSSHSLLFIPSFVSFSSLLSLSLLFFNSGIFTFDFKIYLTLKNKSCHP